MFLYHLPLLEPSNVPLSVALDGAVVIVRGASLLEYLELDVATGQLVSRFSQDVFATVRSLSVMKPIGSSQDLLIISSDSGYLSALRVDIATKQFVAVHQAMLGRSGCRRTIAGDRVSVDAHGRALMVSALERQHFCISVQGREDGSLEWSSPLEAHRNRVICVDLVALCDTAKPTWAAIEMDYGPVDEAGDDFDAKWAAQGKPPPAELEHPKVTVTPRLTFYELDIGLNHVRRLASRPIDDNDAHRLLALPNGALLIASLGRISVLKDPLDTTSAKQWQLQSSFIQTATWHAHYALIADTQGHLFKLEFDNLYFYDKIVPRPNALHIFDSGFVVAFSEHSDHAVYQIQETQQTNNLQVHTSNNLTLCSVIENRSPVADAQLIGDTWWMASLHSLTLLTRGHAPAELSRLEGHFTSVHHFDGHILLTPGMLLQVGEADLEEAEAEPLGVDLEAIHVLAMAKLGNVAVQVLPNAVRSKQWLWEPAVAIHLATANAKQVALYLVNGTMAYLEIGEGECRQAGLTPPLPEQLSCMALAPLPQGRQRSRWLAVGSAGQALRLLSCDPQDCLEPHSLQVLEGVPRSVCWLSESQLLVGLSTGLVLKVQIDPVDGSIGETESLLTQPLPIRIIKPVSLSGWIIISEGGKAWLYNERGLTPILCPLWDACRLNDRLWLGLDLNGVAIIYHLGASEWSRRQITLESRPRRILPLNDTVACLCEKEVQIFNKAGEQIQALNVDRKILSGCWLQWHGKPGQWYLALGHEDAISVYDASLVKVHVTAVEGSVLSMTGMGGMLLAGIGNLLRLYDLGIKRLLRKAECRVPHAAVALETQGWRIYVLDLHAGPMMGQWRGEEGRLVIQADDVLPRPSTHALAILDYDTMIGADRVGNVWASRWSAHLPQENIVATGKQENLFGAAMRLDRLVEFNLGDTVVKLLKLEDRLVYVTVQGAIGQLIPMRSKRKAQMLQALELALRNVANPLARDHLAYRSHWVPAKGTIDGALCAQYAKLTSAQQHQIADSLETGATTPTALLRLLSQIN